MYYDFIPVLLAVWQLVSNFRKGYFMEELRCIVSYLRTTSIIPVIMEGGSEINTNYSFVYMVQ